MRRLFAFSSLIIVLLPGAAFAKSPLRKLENAYPELSSKQVRKKFEAATSPQKFTRSFVRYFYKYLKKHQAEYPTLGSLLRFQGMAAGDAHEDNFGIRFVNGQPIITISDFDDVMRAPVILDLFAYLSRAQQRFGMIPTERIGPLIEAYQEGLSAMHIDGLIQSFRGQGLLKAAHETGPGFRDRLISGRKLIRIPSTNESEPRDLNKSERIALEKVVNERFHVTLIDVYRSHKIDGGSAFSDRLRVLVEDEHGELQILRMKAIERSALSEFTGENEDSRRFDEALGLWIPAERPYMGPIEFDGAIYFCNPIIKGEKSFNTDGIKGDWSHSERIAITRDQLRILGFLHGKSLGSARARSLAGMLRARPLLRDTFQLARKLDHAYYRCSRLLLGE